MTNKRCLLTGSTEDLQEHHIFFGNDRKTSDEHGFVCWLRKDRHLQNSKYKTPHNHRGTDLLIKKYMQCKFEREHSREEFMQLIGKNYLEDGEIMTLPQLLREYHNDKK